MPTRHKKLFTIIIVMMIVIIGAFFMKHHWGNHEDHLAQHNSSEGDTAIIEWTPSIRSALQNEMKAITVNYQNLVTGITQGNWEDVVEQSHAIYSSFILKQELSEEDMQTLHRILPERFIEMDTQFHDQAKKLAMAAKQHDSKLVSCHTCIVVI